jgi:hypothetical protein
MRYLNDLLIEECFSNVAAQTMPATNGDTSPVINTRKNSNSNLK